MAGCGCSIFRPTRPTAIPMNWSGNISKPTRLAEWRSPTKRISTPRSVHPCANYKTTPRKSVLSIKSHPSTTLHEVKILMASLIHPGGRRQESHANEGLWGPRRDPGRREDDCREPLACRTQHV